jgi:hypothetical protein
LCPIFAIAYCLKKTATLCILSPRPKPLNQQ